MTAARLYVEQAGPLTTFQDAGRPGFARFGVPESGPVDRLAHAAANLAVKSPLGATGIELSLGGLILRCDEGEVGFALCGGDFTAEIDGKAIGSWVAGTISAGSRLRIRQGTEGNWGYLALAGEIEAAHWLDSSSTHLLAALGGGRVVGGSSVIVHSARTGQPLRFLPQPKERPITVARMLLGPQDRYFDPMVIDSLKAGAFAASSSFDRMGMVIDGPPLVPDRVDMPSEPATRGALQVTGIGRLTMLSADHQTTGGYPKIAVVIGADVDRVAQLRAGSPLRFHACTLSDAVTAWQKNVDGNTSFLQEVASEPLSIDNLLRISNLIDGVVDAIGFVE